MNFIVILFSFACHHRIRIETTPSSVEMYRNSELIGFTPQEIDYWWSPFRKQTLELRILGYRDLVFPLQYPFSRLPIDILLFRYDIIFGFTPVNHRITLQKEEQ